ncbi:MAG: hypothetical protein RL757_1760 [Bacteroidota bacterium]|jgi:hypothetical protein
MIATTYTYVSVWSSAQAHKPYVLPPQFSETQTDVDMKQFLTDFLLQKNHLAAAGMDKIAIFHTILYENQCNTEFSPEIMELVQQTGATFCISAGDLKPTKILESVVVDEKFALYDVIEKYAKEIDAPIFCTDNDENEVLFTDIEASNLTNRQIFELGFRYGQRTEFDKNK